jgi:dihydrofolate synthase/folylpolyglutamate synthase
MILVDAAHNPHGIDALVDALGEAFSFTALVGIVGVLADKDAEGILSGLEPILDHVVVTTVDSPRSLAAADLQRIAANVFGEERVTVADSLVSAIDVATSVAERDDDMGAGVIIVGSVLLVAEARVLLGADKRKGSGRAR